MYRVLLVILGTSQSIVLIFHIELIVLLNNVHKYVYINHIGVMITTLQ